MTCPRRWSVEAARDGRLVGAEAALVTRHLALCADCAEEARRLAALGNALRALPSQEVDSVSVRRAKQRLLAAADAQLVAPATRRLPATLALLAAAAAIAATLLFFLARRERAVTAQAAASVEERGAAVWTRKREGQLETITLSEGTLSLRVRRSSPDDRVIVVAPDGEIEDLGTTFSVEVSRLHTERVAVVEGAVIVRRRGEPPLRLLAGESWVRRPETPSSEASAVVPPPSSPVEALPAAPPSTVAPARPRVDRPRPAASTSEFKDGFRALEDGNNGVAAARLSDAARQATDDSRAEDAAYLRVVALSRAGSKDKARELAREYLRRFPRGFRRPEMEAIAN